ncbi:TPA: flagellin [Kluyvera georgiana]|uniref:Flagellin n=1 Tax=Kluyvera georgiana ATCC 51603 TaxID=1354264 RepID=A0A1B7K1B3_9ENTR|nr:flagellin [Kluyvera georgiana]OAT53950.1 FliC family flagellar biosynthesis protein [Kluyvera georgiana ATCC 51603]
MAQVINTNSLSLITQNNINKNQSALSSSIERLSSGLRINSAKDDAAGQAIANRFTSNIKGLTQAARNANDGISVAQTTEGALSEINNNLQRVRELTVQATTGTNSESDLSSIQDEIKSRLDEIDRVSGQTQFNGVNVLAKDGSMKIQVGANDGETITIDLKAINSSVLGLSGFDVNKTISSSDLATTATTQLKEADSKVSTAKFSFTDTNTVGPMKIAVDNADADKLYVTDGTNYYDATYDKTSNTLKYNSTATAAGIDGTKATIATAGQDISVGGGVSLHTQDVVGFTDGNTAAQPALYMDKAGKYYAQMSDNSYRAATVDAASGTVTFSSKAADKIGVAVDFATTSTTGITGAGGDEVVDGLVKDTAGNYFANVTGTKAGLYAASVNATTGVVTLTGTAVGTPTGATTAVTTVGEPTGLSSKLTEIDTPSSTPAVDVDLSSVTNVKNAQLFALKDGSGYVIKGSDADGKDVMYKATVDTATGKVTQGDQVTSDPLAAVDDAIATVDKFRSSLGAIQNRLDSAITNLNNTTTNLSEAQSRIQDADYATEVSNMSKAQIIQQAGNSVLAKANQVPQQVLSLLQG